VKGIGFLVNPIAGMGGRVGLKGTDGVVEEAIARGARPVSPGRAVEALAALRREGDAAGAITWFTCSGVMGADELGEAGFHDEVRVVYTCGDPPSAEDTRAACRAMVEEGVDLILFCGGDGTARDIYDVIGGKVTLLGIPAGVKMHSGVFGIHPRSVAAILADFVRGRIDVTDADILDLDEERYRRGEWSLRLYGAARTLNEPSLIQTGKLMVLETTENAVKDEIGDYVQELMEEEGDTLFVLGPGSTVDHIARRLGLETTLLGVDAVRNGEVVGRDLDEAGLLKRLDDASSAKLLVSPIGAQGFVLGRGNLQLSPAVVRRIGVANLFVVATPLKLSRTPVLRVDTGDPALDREIGRKGYLFVVIGYRTRKLHPIQV
jgi:predicted polyphosphate/ATP-dependent NAD kinase